MTRLLADANIPHAEAAFGPYGVLSRKPGRALTRDDLLQSDILLVRSVTSVDMALVEDTPVRFVGSATAGTDHVDLDALQRLGVAFASAPGSNASSVVDWVMAALLALAADRGQSLDGKTLGVVGVGEVGRRLVPRARALGMRVAECDPVRAARDPAFEHRDLVDVLARADIVTLHTPLTTPDASPFPTLSLIDAAAVAAMRPGAWLLNASRGRVVEESAVLAGRRSGRIAALALDVWPDEPTPDPTLVSAADLATPHIAGYASEAKTRGTAMIADALAAWALDHGIPAEPWRPMEPEAIPLDAPDLPAGVPASRTRWLDALARDAYDIRADDARFRAAMDGVEGAARAAAFSALRRDYPERHEMSRFALRQPAPTALARSVRDGLGIG